MSKPESPRDFAENWLNGSVLADAGFEVNKVIPISWTIDPVEIVVVWAKDDEGNDWRFTVERFEKEGA